MQQPQAVGNAAQKLRRRARQQRSPGVLPHRNQDQRGGRQRRQHIDIGNEGQCNGDAGQPFALHQHRNRLFQLRAIQCRITTDGEHDGEMQGDQQRLPDRVARRGEKTVLQAIAMTAQQQVHRQGQQQESRQRRSAKAARRQQDQGQDDRQPQAISKHLGNRVELAILIDTGQR